MSSATEESDTEVPEQNKTQSEEGSFSGSTTDAENPVQTDNEEGAVGGTKAPAESYHSEKEEDSIHETDDDEEARSSPIHPTPPSDGEKKVPASKPIRGRRRRTVIEMAMDAIEELKNKRGSSVIAIVKYLKSNGHEVANERRFNSLVHRRLKQGVTDGQVTQLKRSFKLSQATINERKAEEKMNAQVSKEQEQKAKGKKEAKSNKKAKDEEEEEEEDEEEVPEVSSEEENPNPRKAAKRRAKSPATGRGKPAKASERKTNQPRKKMKKNDGSASAVAVTSTSNKAAAAAAVLAAMEKAEKPPAFLGALEMAGPSRKRIKRMITEVVSDNDEDDDDDDDDEKAEDDDDEEDEDDEDNKDEDPLEMPQSKKGKGAALIKIKLPDSFSTSKLVAQATSTPQAADKKTTRKRK
ncbi:DNA ligase 1-like [Drosophila subobscura]|uniref:DNA ligase 1-like n=1 Tax=Drosophila subobscura TaxID=7241 RepID=UPI00155B02DE|nr:DNA ligase 1-like [Drosophila subobscura]